MLHAPCQKDLFEWLETSGIRQITNHESQIAVTPGFCPQSSSLKPQSSSLNPQVSSLKPQVSLSLWGSGTPLREFLYSDDLAEACVFLVENVRYSDLAFTDPSGTVQSHINIGSGIEMTIHEIAEVVQHVVGFNGEITWDPSKPDGTPRKLMDSSRIHALGWKPAIDLKTGIGLAYKDYLARISGTP
jgi:nucleoside-diphosphate-sugar epimerase